MPIQYASLPEEAQQELAALITQVPNFSAAYAYRLRSSPRGDYTTAVIADPDEARIFINANFEEVVGIPLPLSIRQDGPCRDRYIANLYRDAKWYAQSEYWVRPVAFVRAEDEVEFNQNFSATVCPETGYVHYQPSPIQKPAHVDPDYISVSADNSFRVYPKFAIHQRVLLLKQWAMVEIKNYTFEVVGAPKKCGLTLRYVDKDGDVFYEDELRSDLSECRMCEELTAYKNECVVCGWEDQPAQMPEDPMPHPSMSAAERNGHYGPAFRK